MLTEGIKERQEGDPRPETIDTSYYILHIIPECFCNTWWILNIDNHILQSVVILCDLEINHPEYLIQVGVNLNIYCLYTCIHWSVHFYGFVYALINPYILYALVNPYTSLAMGTYHLPNPRCCQYTTVVNNDTIFNQKPPTTLNLLPDKYFDLWLSIDTQTSPLCDILLRLRAAKWRWSKMKFFNPKKVEISNFELQKCYIPQKKAENIYNKDSARKSKISCKK